MRKQKLTFLYNFLIKSTYRQRAAESVHLEVLLPLPLAHRIRPHHPVVVQHPNATDDAAQHVHVPLLLHAYQVRGFARHSCVHLEMTTAKTTCQLQDNNSSGVPQSGEIQSFIFFNSIQNKSTRLLLHYIQTRIYVQRMAHKWVGCWLHRVMFYSLLPVHWLIIII